MPLQANLEVPIGRSLQASSPRLLAAARILCATSGAELRGRGADTLCDPARPLSPLNEARSLPLRRCVCVCFDISKHCHEHTHRPCTEYAISGDPVVENGVGQQVKYHLSALEEKPLLHHRLRDMQHSFKCFRTRW